jgi:hypothetical protein
MGIEPTSYPEDQQRRDSGIVSSVRSESGVGSQ